ncbi:MAG: EamA family transporter [Verrucomicrobia bacterium]|nr:EamA family transporter [Verrucomicrobiota bacterium]MCH8510559.1 EamA family transporter [Kiritimatiellia bacterium]
MHFAIITAILWSFAGFGSSRLARLFGAAQANFLRLFCSTILLALLAWGLGIFVLPAGAWLFALSGFLHLAVGDVGLFAVYRRLGPRIGVLAVSCLAPPIALVVEWAVLGTVVLWWQLTLAAGVLVCVAFAVAPRERMHLTPFELRRGILAGAIATLGQGSSAAVSRMGYAEVSAAGQQVGPFMPTLLRCASGCAGVFLWLLWRKTRGQAFRQTYTDMLPHRRIGGHPMAWLAVSTLLGPVIGVLFLMKALETTPSVLVQAGLSTLPIFMIPVAWFFDGNAPSRRSLACGVLAIALVILTILGGRIF